jgi:biopolymer transport protein ExbD
MMRKKRGPQAVELNLAAMLDMAFQLLTFFILTFKPAPVEGEVALRLPPPQLVGPKVINPPNPGTDVNQDALSQFSTLSIFLTAGDGGQLRQIRVAEDDLPVDSQLKFLNAKLSSLLNASGSPFDQVVIQVGSKLRYDELMHVVDICTRQTLGGDPNTHLAKLSLVDESAP